MIGLDTGHLVYNYGTKLQAYAMQMLLEQNGDRCEIIQWHTKNFGVFNPLVECYKTIKKLYSGYGLKINYWIKIIKRYKALNKFNNKYHIKKYFGSFETMQEKVSHYSRMFCGSDQAWLPENVLKHWYTLEFCNSNQIRTAYAPSFGVDNIENKYWEYYRNFLSKFDYLSVREISGQHIIKKLIDKDVPVVLDPTLLLKRNDWDKLINESTIEIPKIPYIFCYFLGMNKEHRELVKQFGKEEGLIIVNIPHFSGYCEADIDFGDINLFDVSPQDFIALINNACYICTDSFHCTAFSIQYEKPFTVFHRFGNNDKKSTNTRLYSLLEQLGLSNHIVNNEDKVNADVIDYATCNKLLENLRYLSNQFLQEALSARK